jgi:hypothetical protein
MVVKLNSKTHFKICFLFCLCLTSKFAKSANMINKNLWVYAEFETDFESDEKVEKNFIPKKLLTKM